MNITNETILQQFNRRMEMVTNKYPDLPYEERREVAIRYVGFDVGSVAMDLLDKYHKKIDKILEQNTVYH